MTHNYQLRAGRTDLFLRFSASVDVLELNSLKLSCAEYKRTPGGNLFLKAKLSSFVGNVKGPEIFPLRNKGSKSIDYLIRSYGVDHENNQVIGLDRQSAALKILWAADTHSYVKLITKRSGKKILREIWEGVYRLKIPELNLKTHPEISEARLLYRDFAFNPQSGKYQCLRTFYVPK